MEEKSTNFVMLLIIALVGFVVFLLLFDSMLGGKIVRNIVCGILFWIPGAASGLALTQGCAAIPA